jgi:hypothetical protein
MTELLGDRMVRIVCSILIVLVTTSATIAITSRPQTTDRASCQIAEHALEDAYIRMRKICNGPDEPVFK